MDDIEYLQKEVDELKAKNTALRKKVFELQAKLQEYYKQQSKQYRLDADHLPYPSDEENWR